MLFFPLFFLLHIYVIYQHGDLTSIINEKGCLMAGEEWLEKNLLVVAGVAVGIAFLQVCNIHAFSIYKKRCKILMCPTP